MTTIGIIGFGEVGATFAARLAGRGAKVRAFDAKWLSPHSPPVAAEDAGITRCASLEKLLASAEIVLSSVTTNAAIDVARNCAAVISGSPYFCDLNSTAPATKIAIGRIIEAAGGRFVEGAILGAIGVSGADTELLLGGTHAGELATVLGHFGLKAKAYSAEIGRASTYKLLRSVFSKGMEALLLEFRLASRAADMEDELWSEVVSLFDDNRFEAVAGNWIRSHGVAHERRYHEMEQVTDLLKTMGLDVVMTEATLAFFRRSTDDRLAAEFPSGPTSPDDVVARLAAHVVRS